MVSTYGVQHSLNSPAPRSRSTKGMSPSPRSGFGTHTYVAKPKRRGTHYIIRSPVGHTNLKSAHESLYNSTK